MRILIAGDFAPRNRVVPLLESKSYDALFGEIGPVLSTVDYSIVNLEAPVINGNPTPIIKTGPNLSCTKNSVEAIKWAGFNCVTLANNHFRDQGEQGVNDTIMSCKEFGLDYVGGGNNVQTAEQTLYKVINGKTLAIINFCENEWSIATEECGGSAPLHPIKNYYKITEARQKADAVVVIVHGGTEHYQLPTPRMKETYRFFVDAGADAVVNHHQHCFSGYEIYQEKPIVYGLGNFCFDKNAPADKLWNEGYMVLLDFQENKVMMTTLPYIQCAEQATIHMMDNKDVFQNNIMSLNEIIADDNKLNNNFLKMASHKQSLMALLEPFQGKYVSILRAKGLMPSFLDYNKKNLIIELFRCEAHRDVMFHLLNEEK